MSVKKFIYVKKDYVWNPATCNFENGKYLASIRDKTICDEVIDVKEMNFNEKIITCLYFIYLFINQHCIIDSC